MSATKTAAPKTPTPTSAFDFIGDTLSQAGREELPSEKYKEWIDSMCFVAAKDPEIEFVLVLRKKKQLALLGVQAGMNVSNNQQAMMGILRMATGTVHLG